MESNEAGGDAACWLHRVCDECGAIVDDANPHRAGCSQSASAPAAPRAAVVARSEPRWIPATPVIAGLAFQLAGWIIVAAHALRPSPSLALAWVHAVALGWLTTIALAVLIRIVPSTTDREWRFEPLARGSLAGVAGGALLIVAGFLTSTYVLAAGGVVATASIAVYLFAAFRTLEQPGGGRRERTIANALGTTLFALGLTAVAGLAMAILLANGTVPSSHLVLLHVAFGVIAWLTVLTTGVAARTLRVILDVDARAPRAHALVGSTLSLGALVLVVGGLSRIVEILAFAAVAIGAIAFAFDALDRAMRSTTRNAVARLGVAAAAAWIVVAAAFALAAAAGAVDPAIAVVGALLGWIGSMMFAHLHHIGVRLIATSVIGEDDETPPEALISSPIAIAALVLYQIAVIVLVVAVARGATHGAPANARADEIIAALYGIVASALLALNGRIAIRRARAVRSQATAFAAQSPR